MRTCGEEVKARGAEVFVVTDNPALADGLDATPLVIPRNGPLTALTAVLPLQVPLLPPPSCPTCADRPWALGRGRQICARA